MDAEDGGAVEGGGGVRGFVVEGTVGGDEASGVLCEGNGRGLGMGRRWKPSDAAEGG